MESRENPNDQPSISLSTFLSIKSSLEGAGCTSKEINDMFFPCTKEEKLIQNSTAKPHPELDDAYKGNDALRKRKLSCGLNQATKEQPKHDTKLEDQPECAPATPKARKTTALGSPQKAKHILFRSCSTPAIQPVDPTIIKSVSKI